MRTIKFKALAYSQNWVYGNFIHSKRFEGCSNEFRIHEPDTGIEHDVIGDTVCEFTGIKDSNGVDIYEGDILQNTLDERLFNWIIFFENGSFGIRNIGVDGFIGDFFNINSPYFFIDRAIIGNIYTDPELLKNNMKS